jgi:hypothetical protein
VTSVYVAFSLLAIILASVPGPDSPWLAGGGTAVLFALAMAIWLGLRRRLHPWSGRKEEA